jgi:S-adenosylmethionine decarboxylase proenzyme
LYHCEEDLDDLELIRKVSLEVARRDGLTVVQEVTHQFSPHGVSCVLVLAESHLSIHTWPEHGYVAVDLFTCEERVDGDQILKHFQEVFRAGRMEKQFVRRGSPH